MNYRDIVGFSKPKTQNIKTKPKPKPKKNQIIEGLRGDLLLMEYNSKVQAYSDELGKYIMGLRPRIAGLKFDVEHMSGSWLWEKGDIAIYATWGWEGKAEVPIELPDGGDVVKTLKYKQTGDLKKDARWYISNMKRYLPGIYRDEVKGN